MTSTPFIKAVPELTAQLNREGIKGDFAEIGVLAGRTFVHLVRHGKESGRGAHAFDSFEGMATPGPYDGDQYPKGRFDMGGLEGFQQHMKAVHLLEPEEYHCWPGYIPECFFKFDEACPGKRFGMVLIDVDHYEPTRKALNFVVGRMSIGGFLVLDDYLPGTNKDGLATRAIEEWLAEDKSFQVIKVESGQLFLRKVA